MRVCVCVLQVHIEVTLPEGTRSKGVKVEIRPSYIKVVVLDKVIIEVR